MQMYFWDSDAWYFELCMLFANMYKKGRVLLDNRLMQTRKMDVEMSSHICGESLFDYNCWS